MAKMLDSKGTSPGFAEFIREQLGCDPEASGFRRAHGSVTSLDYDMHIGKNRLKVNCRVSVADGRRWLALRIEKHPETVGFHDVSFVRRAFLGAGIPAMIFYGPDEAQVPASDSKVELWTPLDEATLPSGQYRRRER